jgi:hypothetical protein
MRSVWVLLIFVLVSFARAETKQRETADVPWGKQPDHLVPLVPETGSIGRYRNLIFKHLCITPAQFGRMALEIGFYEPEWVVSVYGEDEIGTNTTQYKSYHIAVAKAHDSIWTSLPSNNDEQQQKPIEISREDAVIDRIEVHHPLDALVVNDLFLVERHDDEASTGVIDHRTLLSYESSGTTRSERHRGQLDSSRSSQDGFSLGDARLNALRTRFRGLND